MPKIRLLMLVSLLTGLLSFAQPAKADTPPDVIKNYTITVTPQNDGALKMEYRLDYCATTDFPSDQQHLWVGVPNDSFEIQDYGPKDWVTSANARTGGASQVELNFAHLPKAGECFSLTFTILQHRMAYPNGEQVSFVFTPGWFDFAKIDTLTINWMLPADASHIRGLDPAPTSQEGGQATWTTTNLAPNQKFTIKLLLDKSVFGNLADPAQSDPAATGGGGGGGISMGTIILIVVIVIVAFFLLMLLIAWLDESGGGSSGGGYSGGTYIGGYHGGGSSSSGGGRSGGGSGSFGSRGSSCACVSSCACACACAGGGRVGCSEKGYDISRLLKKE